MADLEARRLLLPQDSEPAMSAMAPATGEVDPLSRDPLSLDDLLAAADRYNPAIGQAKAAIGAAAGAAWQAGLYPNPALELEAEEIPLSGNGVASGKYTVGIVQPVVVSRRLSAASAGGEAEERAAILDLLEAQRSVFGDVRRQVAEILYLRAAIDLRRELLDVAGRTLRIAETRFDARAAPESEVIRARVEADGLDLSVERFRRELAAAAARLAALLGGREVAPERLAWQLPPTGPALDLESMLSMLDGRHPRVLAAAERVEAAEHRLEQARAGRHPDIGARVAYGYDGEFDEHIVEAGVILPLTLYDRNQGGILKARYEVSAAREDAKAVLNDLRAALAGSYERYMSARQQAAAFETRIVEPAARSLEQTREGYTAGRLAFLDLLDAQRTLAQARVARLELMRDLAEAQADLHGILGESLQAETSGDQPSTTPH